jgi:acetyltransferase-like isoleucine patch superfamily enzyme
MNAIKLILIELLSKTYSYRYWTKITRFLNQVYSCALRREFRSSGEGFYIEYPAILHGCEYIEIGKHFKSFARLRLEAFDSHLGFKYTPFITIGDNVSINYDCHIGCVNRIDIGNNVLMASKIFITDHYHGEINYEALNTAPSQRKVESKGPVVIEDNVWIGDGVAIMPNVTIGRNCIIGANSVVTSSMPPNAVVAGVPAKVIRILDKE